MSGCSPKGTMSRHCRSPKESIGHDVPSAVRWRLLYRALLFDATIYPFQPDETNKYRYLLFDFICAIVHK
jgi:hypothetical protein